MRQVQYYPRGGPEVLLGNPLLYSPITTKMCTSCKTENPVAEFRDFGKNGKQIDKWREKCFQKKKGRTANPSIAPSPKRA